MHFRADGRSRAAVVAGATADGRDTTRPVQEHISLGNPVRRKRRECGTADDVE
jgi:hypothetical protein